MSAFDPNVDGIDVDGAVEVVVTDVIRDEGTIVIFHGEHGDQEIDFAVDHRPAQDLADAVERDEHPLVLLEPWQIVSRRSVSDAMDFPTERVLGQQKKIADRLRDLADEVDRERLSEKLPHPHATLANNIIHKLAWGFANLNTSALLDAAADAEYMKNEVGLK